MASTPSNPPENTSPPVNDGYLLLEDFVCQAIPKPFPQATKEQARTGRTSQSQRDLWPADIAVTTVVCPVAILRQQAALLAEKTGGLVEGEVSSNGVPSISGREADEPTSDLGLSTTLCLKVPALDNYRYSLLRLQHGPLPYPLNVRYLPTQETLSVAKEEEFLEVLRGLFSRRETVEIVQSLIAQVQAVAPK